MNVLICGGRDFTDWTFFRNEMHRIAEREFPRTERDCYGNYLYEITIIAGGARGTDMLALSWAVIEHTGYKQFDADWRRYDKAAGPIRNQQMLDEGKPDLVISFPGGIGTADMVRRAKSAGIRVIEVKQ